MPDFKGVIISADNLRVESGSTITANERGYASGESSSGIPGQGPGGGGLGENGVGGGGYGGRGGTPQGGSVYGSALQPVDLGHPEPGGAVRHKEETGEERSVWKLPIP